jgi:hypothetical protein
MTQDLQTFLDAVKAGQPIEFQDTLAIIAANYAYSPVRFTNGLGDEALVNAPGMNEGSCKIFSFARLNGLDEAATLALFGRYYRDEVLGHPEGTDHMNIRNFMRHGWAGIHFDGPALRPN